MTVPAPAQLYRRLGDVQPHLRTLFLVSLVEAMGRGVFLSGNIVFFTLYAGLEARQVALGVSAAAVAGLVASVVMGMLADRVGARRLLTALLLLQAVGFALYPFTRTPAAFYLVIVAVGFLEWGMQPTKGAVVSAIVAPDERVRTQAQMRTIFNVGFSLGSALATVAALGRSALVLIPATTALMMLAAAVTTRRLPNEGRGIAVDHAERRFEALRDRRFVVIVALSTVQAAHVTVLMVALPLWVLQRTDLPHAVLPLNLIVNTAVVIVFQVRASRGTQTVLGAARTARTSTWWLASACGLAALTATTAPALAGAALILCVVALSIAEIMQAAAGWGLAYGLAPEHAQGEYLGTFGLHVATQSVVGPLAISGMVLTGGVWGWGALAAVVTLSGLLVVPVAAGAGRAQGS
jgi:MFS family permease